MTDTVRLAPIIEAIRSAGSDDPAILAEDALEAADDADRTRGVIRLDTRDIYTAAFVINAPEVQALPVDASVPEVVTAVMAFIRSKGKAGGGAAPPVVHDSLTISTGDEEFWAHCSCGQQLGPPVRPDQSFDRIAQRWDRHIHPSHQPRTVGPRS